MKKTEKDQARLLRQQGWSINEIYPKLQVAKSSVSIWVRDIELTTIQKKRLSKKGHSLEVIEKRRTARLENETQKRNIVINEAREEYLSLSSNPLFLIGTALYWAEGAKRSRGMVAISNGDPEILKIAIRFFLDICHVPHSRLRGHLHIHPHLNVPQAEQYWSKVTGIPLIQFIKTYNKPNRASKNKKDSLPYGTLSVYTCDTNLLLRIKGWIKSMAEATILK